MKMSNNGSIKLKFFLCIMILISFVSCSKKFGVSSNIKSDSSYMYAMFENSNVTLDDLIKSLENNKEFNIVSKKQEENSLIVELTYKGILYKPEIRIIEMDVPDSFTNVHGLGEEELKKVLSIKNAIATKMDFISSSVDAYHFQLKLLHTMAPKAVAVVDYSAYKILDGKWVDSAVKSKFPPAPIYLASIFVISENEKIWLYTAGLRRIGSLEMEIMNSDVENYGIHSQLLETLVTQVITGQKLPKSGEPFNYGRNVILTWIPTDIALKDIKKDSIGSAKDRVNDIYKETAVLSAYLNENDAKKKKISPISAINNVINKGTLYYISDAEGLRMSGLAKERWEYPVRALKNANYTVNMKFAIPYEVTHTRESYNEHMWFDIKQINGDEIVGVLMNSPFYVTNMKLGDEVKLNKSQLSDWIIYSDKSRITPDTAYKFDEDMK